MTALGDTRASSIADWFGIAASAVCAAHCLVVPVLLVTGTLLPASILADEAFHKAMFIFILPAAIIAFGFGCRRHRDRWVIALGVGGVLGMILSITLLHEIAGELGERVGTIFSASILIAAHYRNFRLCRSSDCTHTAN